MAPFASPAVQPFDLGASPAELGLNLLADATLSRLIVGHVHKSHPACFARAILVIAPVGEIRPAPVTAGKSLLVVEAHAYQMGQPWPPLGPDQTHLLSEKCSRFTCCVGFYWLTRSALPRLKSLIGST